MLWFFVFDDDDISIHTLCEEGDDGEFPADVKKGVISIHTLCEEGDLVLPIQIIFIFLFQSTPSVKRATRGLFCGLR